MAAALAGLFFYSSCSPTEKAETKDYTRYVNTFIGAADNGHTFPGACYPFGMIQSSPVTGAVGWRYCSEYTYQDSLIWGFTQTHLNGTGCMDLGDILVMPVTGTRTRAWDAYRSHFPKDKEAAAPGYYTVELSDPQVKAELTASIHAALHRYTYNKADSASLLIDLQHGPAWREEQYHSHVKSCEVNWEDAQTLTGHVNNAVWVNQDYFFVIKFNRPVADSLYLPMGETEKGKRIVATFDIQPGDELMMKVALSTTSVAGAKKNLEAEIPAWDFDGVRDAAHNEWNSYLSRIEIEGTDDEKTNFYTSFYHALIQPNEISDVDGMYRNAADSVVKAGTGTFYSTFSLWDTYRAAHPFYTLIIPERVDGFVNSLIEQGEVQGFLPIWALWGKENYCMIGNHGVSVIAEAYRKGFRGFDAERAFNIIKKTQTVSHPLKSNWEVYTKYGYFPTDLIKAESVSSTLESVYDDYAAADMARRMGKEEDAAYFAKRADYYKTRLEVLGMGLENRLGTQTGSLSGGQRQALALIMATLKTPDVLLLDEHTAALDPKSADIVMKLTDEIVKGENITTIMVTHNLRYAAEYGSRTVMMHDGKAIMDIRGNDKKNNSVNDYLDIFNSISIECGN